MACVRSPETTQREDALRRLFALPHRELLEAVDLVLDYLNAGPGRELVVSREVREQHEALDALQAVRDELGLTDSAPTPKEFDLTAKRLGLNWDRNGVIRAHGRWKNATHAVMGGRLRETPKQRAIRKAASGVRRSREEYRVGVDRWLDEDPADWGRPSYDSHVCDFNDDLPPGQLPLVLGNTIMVQLDESWPDVLLNTRPSLDTTDPRWLRVMRGHKARPRPGRPLIDETHAQTIEHPLLSRADIGRLTGRNGDALNRFLAREFPHPVANLSGIHAWRTDTVLAYLRGEPVPAHTRWELADEVLGTRKVGELLGLRVDAMHVAISRGDWHRVPRPSGRLGNFYYWWRSEFAAWRSA